MATKLIPSLVSLICCYIGLFICVFLFVSIVFYHAGRKLKFIGLWSILSITLFAGFYGTLVWDIQTMSLFQSDDST